MLKQLIAIVDDLGEVLKLQKGVDAKTAGVRLKTPKVWTDETQQPAMASLAQLLNPKFDACERIQKDSMRAIAEAKIFQFRMVKEILALETIAMAMAMLVVDQFKMNVQLTVSSNLFHQNSSFQAARLNKD